MTKKIISAALVFAPILVCCANPRQTVKKSEKYGLELIELCVDSTIHNPGARNFYLDLDKVNAFEQQAVNAYFVYHKACHPANLDSLFTHDSMWVKHGYFITPVVRVERVTRLSNDTLKIETSLHKSSDASEGRELLFIKTSTGYRCVSSLRTWIS